MSHQCLCANGGWYLGDHEAIIEAVDNFCRFSRVSVGKLTADAMPQEGVSQ